MGTKRHKADEVFDHPIFQFSILFFFRKIKKRTTNEVQRNSTNLCFVGVGVWVCRCGVCGCVSVWVWVWVCGCGCVGVWVCGCGGDISLTYTGIHPH